MNSIKAIPRTMDTTILLLRTVDQIDTEKLTRIQAIVAIHGLIQKLRRAAIREDVNEVDPCIRFIKPFLFGLFDNPDHGNYLCQTTTRVLEAKKNIINTSVQYPDLCITKSLGHK
ncbi:hypothetical protein AB4K20DRAFT_1957261 [Rhizopus microsporus]